MRTDLNLNELLSSHTDIESCCTWLHAARIDGPVLRGRAAGATGAAGWDAWTHGLRLATDRMISRMLWLDPAEAWRE